MAIGLSTRELGISFLESFRNRMKEMNVDLLLADAGIDPEAKKLLDDMKKQFPQMEESIPILALWLSFLDIIVKNNEALAKSVFHVDR